VGNGGLIKAFEGNLIEEVNESSRELGHFKSLECKIYHQQPFCFLRVHQPTEKFM
jgi:hypothetical protein